MNAVVEAVVTADSSAGDPDQVSSSGGFWRRFRKNRLAVVGMAICVALILIAVCAPWIAPYGYEQTNYDQILSPSFSSGHPMGTDPLGRDILSRLIYGLRTAIIVALGAEALALCGALVIGMTAGYFGGLVDKTLMAFADIMYAFPTYLFAVVLVAVVGRSVPAIVVAIAIASWVTQARLVRAQVFTLKRGGYVEAGRSIGASGLTISLRYILPNALGPILVFTSFAIPNAIAAESGLALLGLGVVPPTPSWGTMINEGIPYVLSAPHMLIWPTLAFSVTLLSLTWVGDGLRDAFDKSGSAGDS